MSKNHRKPISRFFPKGHSKAGQQTYFVERLLSSLDLKPSSELASKVDICLEVDNFYPKFHTVRLGNNVKVGDTITFYIWEARPYWSKQIVVAPPIEIKKVWDIEIIVPDKIVFPLISINEIELLQVSQVEELAKNDGLEIADFLEWFPKTIKGQIICWNENINY